MANKNCCRTCLTEANLNSIHLKHEFTEGNKSSAELIELLFEVEVKIEKKLIANFSSDFLFAFLGPGRRPTATVNLPGM